MIWVDWSNLVCPFLNFEERRDIMEKTKPIPIPSSLIRKEESAEQLKKRLHIEKLRRK